MTHLYEERIPLSAYCVRCNGILYEPSCGAKGRRVTRVYVRIRSREGGQRQTNTAVALVLGEGKNRRVSRGAQREVISATTGTVEVGVGFSTNFMQE